MLTKTKLFRLAGYLILAFMFINLSACSNQPSTPLKTAMVTWPGYEPVVLAKDMGFVAENLVINRVISSNDVVNALKSDLIDIAFLTLDEVLTLESKTKESLKILAITDISNGADALLAQPYIKTIGDLKGKKVAMEKTSIASYMLASALESDSEISIDDISISYLGSEKHFEIFQSKAVDAVVTFEPTKSMLLNQGAINLLDSSAIKNEIIDLIVIKEKTLKRNPQKVKDFMQGWFKTIDYIKANNGEAIKKLANYENISIDLYNNATLGLEILTLEDNKHLVCGPSAPITHSISKVQSFLESRKKIEAADIDIERLLSNTICQ